MTLQNRGAGELVELVYSIGQIVRWPHAPNKLAQVDELRRTHVRLFYVCKNGVQRRPVVDAITLDILQDPRDPLLPIVNPFGRAIVGRRKKSFSV